MAEKENILLKKSFEFALKIIEYGELLEADRKFVVSNQLLKAGTSIGANSNEAQSAESRADFIHKLKIADKEARETEYWLRICKYAPSYPNPGKLLDDALELKMILSKIISTTRKNG